MSIGLIWIDIIVKSKCTDANQMQKKKKNERYTPPQKIGKSLQQSF